MENKGKTWSRIPFELVAARGNPSGDRGRLETSVALAIFRSCSLGPGSALGKMEKKIGSA